MRSFRKPSVGWELKSSGVVSLNEEDRKSWVIVETGGSMLTGSGLILTVSGFFSGGKIKVSGNDSSLVFENGWMAGGAGKEISGIDWLIKWMFFALL